MVQSSRLAPHMLFPESGPLEIGPLLPRLPPNTLLEYFSTFLVLDQRRKGQPELTVVRKVRSPPIEPDIWRLCEDSSNTQEFRPQFHARANTVPVRLGK